MQPADLHGRASRKQRWLAAALALATVALGARSIHLARSLDAERARQAEAQVARQTPAMTPVAAAPAAALEPAPPSQPLASGVFPAPSPDPLPANAGSDPQQERQRRRLAELSDPVQRAQRMAEMRAAMESNVEEILATTGLQRHEAELLIDFMAESTLADQLHAAECQLAPDCDQQALAQTRARAHVREMDRIIGPDAMQRLMTRDARERVNAFAKSLPEEHALSPSTIDNLVEAIAASRRHWIDQDTPGSEVEQRLRDRAASMLTTGQLALLEGRHSRMFEID